MRGGLVFFRGAGAAARAYLESDHSHADEYYLENGDAVADWTALDAKGAELDSATLNGDEYQSWVDWKDPRGGTERGTPRAEVRVKDDGGLRVTPASPRFVEMTVNVDKSLSVAAALNPAVSTALDSAEAAAVDAMNTYMASNSVTRVGPRGAQRLVPVDRLESVTVVHRSSRAGDPHRHVHVQWSTRVLSDGKWRALHTAATLKQQGALRGVGEAAINSHEGLQRALADAGFLFDAGTGTVTNLTDQAEVMSKRAKQIERNVSRFEAEWRVEHPGAEPDKELRRQWDQRAWAYERPRKRRAPERAETKWIDELKGAGLQVDDFETVTMPAARDLTQLDVDRIRADVVAASEARGSAWSLADLEGHVGVAVGAAGVTAERAEVGEYVRDVAARIAADLPTLETEIRGEIPGWVRNLTSERVLAVERELRDRLGARGMNSGLAFGDSTPVLGTLSEEQTQAAVAIASGTPLVVVEGAAGSGKTTILAEARTLAEAEGRHVVVLAPTLRAAQEASASVGVDASSAHKLAHEYGYRWSTNGRWGRLAVGSVDANTGVIYDGPSEQFRISNTTRLVIDEAGMLDQDLARAVLTVADETGAGVVLIGDRAQLPAVGRGGVLDMAINASPRPLDLTEVRRFRDAEYARLTVQLRDRRDPNRLFDDLVDRGNLVVHGTEAEAWHAITEDVVAKAQAGATVAVAVTSNEAAAEINALVQDAHARAGHTRRSHIETTGSDGLSLRVGDRVMTRQNNSNLGVANRDTWQVHRIHRDGSVTVRDGGRRARLPHEYVQEHTHLAYASTEYGVQGATVDYGHGVVTDASSAQAVYVSATRGREGNTLHVVAADQDDARSIFTDAVGRESGDRGVEAARQAVERDLAGIVLEENPGFDMKVRTARLRAEERQHAAAVKDWEQARTAWQSRHPGVRVDDYDAALHRATGDVAAAGRAVDEMEVQLRDGAERAGVRRWDDGNAAVARAQADLERAGLIQRRAAEKVLQDARTAFERTTGAQPGTAPTQQQRAAWAAAATKPGANQSLDAARRALADAQANVDALRADKPVGAKPSPRAQGTPQDEARRDAEYVRRQEQRAGRAAQRQQRRQNEQERRQERVRGPQGRGPEL